MATIGELATQIGIGDRGDERAVVMSLNKRGVAHSVYLADVADQEITPSTTQLYVASGLFADGSIVNGKGRTEENLRRVVLLPFDADLLDYLGHEVSKDPGKQAERERAFDELKRLPQTEIDGLIAALRADLEETVAALGMPIHRLDYTGYGLCAYVYLNEADQTRVDDARAAHKIAVKAINDWYGHQLVDKQCSDAGTRVTRLPGSFNHKGDQARIVTTLIPYKGGTFPLGQRPNPKRPVGQAIPREGDGLSIDDAQAIVNAIAPSWGLGQKHAVSLALAGMLAKSGVPESQALAIVDRLSAGDTKPYDRKRTVESSYARARAGSLVRGYLELRDRIPDDALSVVDGILKRHSRGTIVTARVGILSGEPSRKAKAAKDGDTTGFTPTPMPPGAIVGWLREYVDLAEPTTESSESFHAACMLTVLGACIGKRVGVFHASNALYANFYTLLIGRSGHSRKDTAIGRALKMPMLAPPIGEPLRTLGANFKVVRDISSAEGLIAMLKRNNNLLLYATEFSKVMSNAARESTRSIAPTLIEAFDTPSTIQNNTKANIEANDIQEAKNPYVSILTGIQPRTMARMIGEEEQYSGFLNRWLLVVGGGAGPRPNPPDFDTDAAWHLMVRAMDAITSYHDGALLRFSDKASDRWSEWYIASYPDGSRPEQEDAMSVRLGTLVKKVALVYAVLDRAQAIERQHLDAGIELVDWCWSHTRRLLPTFGEAMDAKIARLILETLKRRGPTQRRKVQQLVGRSSGPGVFGRVVRDMVANGDIVETADKALILVPDDEEDEAA